MNMTNTITAVENIKRMCRGTGVLCAFATSYGFCELSGCVNVEGRNASIKERLKRIEPIYDCYEEPSRKAELDYITENLYKDLRNCKREDKEE